MPRSQSHTERMADLEEGLTPVLVEAVEGPGRGAQTTLSVGTITVGSDRGNDLVLPDKAVSRRHATIELLPGALKVRDLESRNGTFYLKARIEQARVPVGGSVRMGRTVIRFTPVAASVESSERDELNGLFGKTLSMRRLFARLERLGPADSAVLIRGESGVGKEAAARCLHHLSPRVSKPFVVFECAAANPNLIESELFGHVRGAFTGADRTRAGAIETAGDGTLLLDEIGSLPLELQPKLLRVLDTREYKRLGDSAPRRASARVLATTQHDLKTEIKDGRFRADLYFRLAVSEVEIPPLRERPDDIPLLAERFARQFSGSDVQLTRATVAALQCDPWPGNVRELQNAVRRSLALGQPFSEPATPAAKPISFNAAREALVREFERDYLSTLIDRHRGNISAAARSAGLARSRFYRLLARHGLSHPSD